MGGLQAKVDEKTKARPVHEFDIPEPLANGITSIGLVQLSANEELMAVKRSNNDTNRLAYELTMQSLVEVNGKPVRLEDGTVDAEFNSMNPQVRNLVLTAYARLHAPAEDVTANFLKSQRVKVR